MCALAPSLAALPQLLVQHPALALIPPHVAVDRHVAHARAQVPGQHVGDLLRTPLLPGQQRLDACIHVRAMLLHPPAAAAPSVGMFLRLARHIKRARLALDGRCVAAYLATDRAGAALQNLGNIAERTPLPLQHGQGVSFRLGELVVHEGSTLAGGIPSSLPAHLFYGWRRCCTYVVNLGGLTIHSSRTRFVASFKCVVVPLQPLTDWQVAGRLNSGVRPQVQALR